jgi:hypothetical protein
MEQLDFSLFVEINVEGSDLSPLLNAPSLRYLGKSDKKHYKSKFMAINELLSQRLGNDHRIER